MSDLLPWPLWPLLLPLVLVLVLVLVLGSFCPLCQGQQRLSKSSSAAVDDHDDDEGDGNLIWARWYCNIIYQLHERGKWAVQSRERERERVPAGRVLISRLPNNTSQRRTLQQVAG